MKYILSFLFCSSLFLLSPHHAFAQGGDNAAGAAGAPITLPVSAAGTTCGHVDNYNPFSSYGLTSGKDWLYYFCAPTSGPVDIFITNAYGLAPGIMVYSVTPNAGGTNWFATSFTGGGQINSLVTVTVTAGTCYYVMIDNAPQYADGSVTCFNYTATIRYHTTPPAAPLEPACSNIGYDNGNTTGWVGTTGIVTTGATGAATPLYTPLYYSTSVSQHSVTSGAGVDLYGSFPIVNPAGGTNSLRLGDVGTYGNTNQYTGGIPGAQGATMEQKFTVTASNALFVYYYAVVIQNALSDSTDASGNIVYNSSGNPILIPHKAVEQPYFKTDIYDCTGNPVVCGQYLVTGGPNIPGFNLAPGTTDVYYKTWSPVAVDLTPFIGTCVTVRYTVGDCTIGGHFAYAYVDAICQPLAITGVNIVCPTKSTVLSAPVGLFTYSWTPGGLSTQSVVVTPTATTTYTCELTSYTNCKTFLTYSVSLYPQEIASANSATVCNGTAASISATTSLAGGTYSWSPAAPASGNISVSPATTTSYICTYTDPNGCKDTAMARVTVNPIPTLNTPANITVCHNTSVGASAFTSTIAGTTFSWTNSNTTTGLVANGSGNTPVFTALNVGSSPITSIVSVTPTANSCVGPPISYTITVNPIPTVNAVPSATYCSNAAVPANTFTGSVTGTTYNWNNTNTTIGAAASGVNTVAGFGATNAGAATISGVITVTPTANTCVGIPTNYTITVNPIPTVNAVPSATYCNGIAVPANTFTGSVTGTTFNWVNSNTTIGAAASGANTVAGFTASNTGSTPISGVITVTPTANTCTGTPTSYTILVNPIPTVTVPVSASYCSGLTVPISTFSSNIATTIYNWSNSNSAIGLGASGTGNAPSFTANNSGTTSIVGAVTVTPSASGCIGTPVSFSITVNPMPLAPTATDATVCPGSSATLTATAPGGTYAWYDAQVSGTLLITNATYTTPNLNTTTTYYVNTTNSFGCVSPFTPVTANVLNFLTVTASPNQTICIGVTANLNASPSGTGYTYSWDSPGSPAFSTIVNPTVTPVATTIYTVTITSPNGCVGSNQTKVTVNPLPIANPGSPIAFCSGQSGTIGGASTVGYSYAWSPTTGLSSPTISNPSVTLPNAGTTPLISSYSLTVILNGCQANNSVQVTVNPIPISNAGAPITLCAGQTGVIGTTSTTGYAYAWIPATNLSSASASNPTVTGVNGGAAPISTNYTVTTTESATSCQSNAQVLVKILPLPTVNAGSAVPICAGTNNIPLSGAIGGSANSSVWSGGAGNFSPSSSALNATYNPTASEFTSGSVTLSLTAIAIAPCQNVSSTVVINFYPNPVINFTVDNPKGCPVHCVNFTDQSTIAPPDNIQSWSWNFGDGGSSTSQNPAHCYNKTGLYSVTLTATSNHLCSTSLSIPQMIEVYPVPIASFIPSPLVTTITDPNIFFQNTSQDATSYSWNFGDAYCGSIAANTSTLTSPTHTYSVAQDYVVDLIATSIHGCVSEATVTIEVQPEFAFYIPNAFTPGSTEGVNDIFTGMGIGIVTYEMWIFDRWGVNIYYTNDINKGWDGTVQGKSGLVQQDVYTWKVKLKDVFNRNHDYVGHVTVLR
jgi:gliding motility-associated-like protein